MAFTMEDSWERPEKYEMHVIAAIHNLHNAHVKEWTNRYPLISFARFFKRADQNERS